MWLLCKNRKIWCNYALFNHLRYPHTLSHSLTDSLSLETQLALELIVSRYWAKPWLNALVDLSAKHCSTFLYCFIEIKPDVATCLIKLSLKIKTLQGYSNYWLARWIESLYRFYAGPCLALECKYLISNHAI